MLCFLQVQYNPGKRGNIPLPSRNGAPPIPEELHPNSRHGSPGSNQSAGDKEK